MALDRLFISIKIGDNGQYIDGMVLDYFDELETRVNFEEALTPDCSKKFRFIQVDRRMKPKIIELLTPIAFRHDPITGELTEPDKLRVRGGVLPITDLAAFCRVTEEKLRDQINASIPINGLLMGEEIFKNASLYTPSGTTPDLAVITSGDCTVGAGGAAPNYLTYTLLFADIGTLTGNLTSIQVANTAETAVCSLSNALAGRTLLFTSKSSPLGNFGFGYQSTFNMASDSYFFSITNASTANGAINQFSKLNLKHIGTPPTDSALIYFNTNSNKVTNKVDDCLLDGNGKRTGGIRIIGSNTIINVFNATITRCTMRGIRNKSNNTTSNIFSNIAFYSNGIGFWNQANVACVANDIASFSNSSYDYAYGTYPTAGLGSTSASKCASSDDTGSEVGLRNLTASAQFVSLDVTAQNFLKVKKGCSLDNEGVAANNHGIRGNIRPHVE